MLKKIFKIVLKLVGGLIFLAALSYGIFHLSEYATGGKYVKYLSENSEVISLEEQFSYEIMKEDIDNSKLILAGEIHGFEEPGKFDFDFFKYLHKNHDVRHYFAELDFTQAMFLNEYMESGDELLLEEILENWVVVQGRNNKDYFNKYIELHEYFQELPEQDKFEFIGIDKAQDLSLTAKYLDRLAPNSERFGKTSNKVDSLLIQVEQLNAFYENSSDTLFALSQIKSNLKYVQDKENRGIVMFKNFYSLYKSYELENSRVYGYFGLYHVFQYRVNGHHPLASNIRQSDLGLENQMLSINFLLNDSHTVMPSKTLPEFMRDEGKYTRMPISADNLLFMYMYGIKDFKRMTPEYHKALIKMNADDSPYAKSNRMTAYQLLPVTDLFEMNDKGKPYVQYTVLLETLIGQSQWNKSFVQALIWRLCTFMN